MSRNNIIVLFSCAIILLTSAYFFYLSRTIDSYYAVYLKTGDLYFGHLSVFPNETMADVYYIQQNQTNNTAELQKFTNSVFDPEDYLTINKDNIVWTAKLSKDSQIVKAIKQGLAVVTDQKQIVINQPEGNGKTK